MITALIVVGCAVGYVLLGLCTAAVVETFMGSKEDLPFIAGLTWPAVWALVPLLGAVCVIAVLCKRLSDPLYTHFLAGAKWFTNEARLRRKADRLNRPAKLPRAKTVRR